MDMTSTRTNTENWSSIELVTGGSLISLDTSRIVSIDW